MIDVFFLPVALVTLCLYIAQIVSGRHDVLILVLAILVGLGLSGWVLKNAHKELSLKNVAWFLKQNVAGVIFILLTVAVVGAVLSPLITTQKLNGASFLRFPGVFDYFKHSYTITAINTYGLPPRHPFFPPTNYSYYFGYYLIPSAIVSIFHFDQNSVIYFYALFTDLVSLTCIYWILDKVIRSSFYKVIGLITVFFGTGFDIFPAIQNLKSGFIHIENWYGSHETGIIIYNFFTAFLWQPQHILAAAMAFALGYLIITKKATKTEIVLLFSWVALSSVFVAIALGWWLAVSFIFQKESRKNLLLSGALCVVLLVPYMLSLGNRSGVLYRFNFTPYPFTSLYIVNYLLTLITEYGLALCGLIVLVFIDKPWRRKDFVPYFLAISVPILATLFYRSAGPNDFSMKLNIPVEMLYSVLLIVLLSQTKQKLVRYPITALLLLSVTSGLTGCVFEYNHRWKDRLVLSYDDNNLQQAIRKLPKELKLAVLDRDEWAYHIPSIGYHAILSPSLYDAGVYSGNTAPLKGNYQYSSKGEELFINPDSGKDIQETVARREKLFGEIKTHLSFYDIDEFVIPKRNWVKEGQNFWNGLFEKTGASKTDLTNSYTIYDRASLVDHLDRNVIKINLNKERVVLVKDKSFEIDPGLWYMAACAEGNQENLRVELDEYFSLFQIGRRVDINCGGQVFFVDSKRKATFSSSTNVSALSIFPVEVLPVR